MRKLVAVCLLTLLGACSSPSDGPSSSNILNGRQPGTDEKIPIVELSAAPLTTMVPSAMQQAPTGPGLAGLRSGGYTGNQIRRGDVIQVTVLDTGEDGLFSPTNSKTLDLGRFTVDDRGSVAMPFVGRQSVAGSTPEAVQSRIVKGLKGSAVNPQAVVTVVDRPTSAVAVSGAVRSAARLPLATGKERILDVIASAGGASGAPNTTIVTLVRGQQRADASLDRIMTDNKQNIYVQPGDQVIVGGDEPSFTAFGAFKSVGEFKFEPGRLTLAQALGRTGGLLDDRADARNVYLLRKQIEYTNPVLAQTVVSKDAGTVPAQTTTAPGTPKGVIYHIDMKDVSNFVLMQQFQMQNGDILYATNASMVNWAKLWTVFQKSASTAAAALPAPSPPSPPSMPTLPMGE